MSVSYVPLLPDIISAYQISLVKFLIFNYNQQKIIMKKLLMSLACAATIVLTSCGGGGTQSKIDDLKDLKKEYEQLIDEAHDCDNAEDAAKLEEKAQKLSEKAQQLYKELQDAELTEEQQKELKKLLR